MLDQVHYDQRYNSLFTVYQMGGFTAAGGRLGLTPSAVAQQVHAVERELGVTLFRREDKRLVPTHECEILVKYIEQIQTMCRRMSDDVELAKQRRRHIAIGITPSLENYALASVIERLTASSSSLQVTAVTGSADKLRNMLDSCVIDLAVIEGCSTDGAFNELILDTDYLAVVVPPDSDYAARGSITPEELQKETLIMKPQDSGTRKLFESSMISAGISPERLRIILEISSVDTIMKLVASHYGLSILSEKTCRRTAAEGFIAAIPLRGINMSRSIRIVYRKEHEFDTLLGEIQRCYREAARESSHAAV